MKQCELWHQRFLFIYLLVGCIFIADEFKLDFCKRLQLWGLYFSSVISFARTVFLYNSFLFSCIYPFTHSHLVCFSLYNVTDAAVSLLLSHTPMSAWRQRSLWQEVHGSWEWNHRPSGWQMTAPPSELQLHLRLLFIIANFTATTVNLCRQNSAHLFWSMISCDRVIQ